MDARQSADLLRDDGIWHASPSEAQAYLDFVRNNQVGGQTDGISAEVAEDLGFHTDFAGEVLGAMEDSPSLLKMIGSGPVESEAQMIPVYVSTG